jgi:hypothetical protein
LEHIRKSQQVRECLSIALDQIESNFLNFTVWNYNLYNTEEYKDNWDYENFSLLGPNRKPRNLDVVARPYSKHTSIMLKGKVCEAPTIIYIPYDMHYSPEFTIWATSSEMKWDKNNFLLHWHPAKNQEINQIVIAPSRKYDVEVLPSSVKDMVSKGTTDFKGSTYIDLLLQELYFAIIPTKNNS